MESEGNHESPHTAEDFFDVNSKHKRIINAIIFRVARAHGLPPDQWEDFRQEVLMKFWLWLKARGGSIKNPLGALTALAVNCLIDMHRRQTAERRDSRKEVYIDAPAPDEAQHEPGFEQDIRGEVLMEEIRDSLSDSDRELFEQHFDEGRTLTEIAQERGVTKQAVSAQWNRILKQLKRKLRPFV